VTANTTHTANTASAANAGDNGMRRPWRSLRVQLALLGWAAIYVPVLLVFGVTSVTEIETTTIVDGTEVTRDTTPERSPWVVATVLALGPVAAGLGWWWAGRAVRPIDRVRRVAEEIEGTDLGRRIGLDRGPVEVVALAAGFDAMLDRLERAADTQRRLIEETSHELRTPLAVLTTNAEVLLAQPDAGVDDLRQGIERSQAAAARLERTIDQLLAEARGRARTIARHPTDLVALVRDVVAEVDDLASVRGVALAASTPATLTCSLDPPTVRRAVLNLVDNALRHAPAGSTVTVEVDAGSVHGIARPGETSRPQKGSWARVTVTDHGPGVPADQQDRIFERFWRARPDDPASPGTGLGLPIARQVAEAHGGQLTVRSPLPTGPGAAFTLAFPLR
jgi:signal transduction histidine kinase